MRKPLAWVGLTLLASTASACATISDLRGCPEATAAARARGVEARCSVLDSPTRLVEQSKDAFKARDLGLAYQYLALIHTLHPDSPEDREQFRLAARLFVESYFRNRTRLDSPWVQTEPQFMFAWLEQFFRGAEEFPQTQVEALFIGMHYGMFRDFLAWAQSRPDVSAWTITATKDNGIIESIQGSRAGPGAAGTGSAAAH